MIKTVDNLYKIYMRNEMSYIEAVQILAVYFTYSTSHAEKIVNDWEMWLGGYYDT